MPFLGALSVPDAEEAFLRRFHACDAPALAAAWGISEGEAIARANAAPRAAKRALVGEGAAPVGDDEARCRFFTSAGVGPAQEAQKLASGLPFAEQILATGAGAAATDRARRAARVPFPDDALRTTVYPREFFRYAHCDARLLARLWGLPPDDVGRIQATMSDPTEHKAFAAEIERARARFDAEAETLCFPAEDGLPPVFVDALARAKGHTNADMDREIRATLLRFGSDATEKLKFEAGGAFDHELWRTPAWTTAPLALLGYTVCDASILARHRANAAFANPGPGERDDFPHVTDEVAYHLLDALAVDEGAVVAELALARRAARRDRLDWCSPAEAQVSTPDLERLAARWEVSVADADWRAGQLLFDHQELALWEEISAAWGTLPP